jgi:hypothetical protein
MGKTAEAGVYRAYIEKMKKITQQRREKWWTGLKIEY